MKLRKILKSNEGNISILMVLMIVGLLGFTAFVVDIGIIFAEKIKLSNALDAATLAGASELPDDPVAAVQIAEDILVQNGVDLSEVTIVLSPDQRELNIVGTREVNHFVAQVLGISKSNVESESTVIVGPASSVEGGLRPFGVEDQQFSYGDVVTLKEGAGGGSSGNYGALALGGTGACNLKYNAIYGYDSKIEIGDKIYTEPGNMSSVVNTIKCYVNSDPSSFDSIEEGSYRLWTIPILDSLDVNGRSEVTVVGFAQFFVENIIKKSGKMEITGRFMKYVTNGEIDFTVTDTGVYGMKLIK